MIVAIAWMRAQRHQKRWSHLAFSGAVAVGAALVLYYGSSDSLRCSIVAGATPRGRTPTVPDPKITGDEASSWRPPYCSIDELLPGEERRGIVRGCGEHDGFFVDIGAEEDAFMPEMETCDGLPSPFARKVQIGDIVTVRILRLQSRMGNVLLTRRNGSLLRSAPNEQPNPKIFRQNASSTWHEGEVSRLMRYGAHIRLVEPYSGRSVDAFVHKTEMTDEFRYTAQPGMNVRVRFNGKDENGRATFSMLDSWAPPPCLAKELQPGEEVVGKVKARNRQDGIFVDIGAERIAYLSRDEFNDGIVLGGIRKHFSTGERITARVLGVDDRGNVMLTRRSGELSRQRAPFEGTADPEAFISLTSRDMWEGVLVSFRLWGAFVAFEEPGTGRTVTAFLRIEDMTDDFKDKAMPGIGLRVRFKNVNDQNEVCLSMFEA